MPRANQRALEKRMKEAGIVKARTSIEKSLRLGHAELTPAGAAIVRRAVAPLSAAITAFVQSAISGRPGRRHTSALPLSTVDHDLAAFVTCQLGLSGAAGNSFVQTTARAIGRALDGEITATRFKLAHPGYYNYIVKREREGARPDAQIMTSIVKAAASFEDEDQDRWSQETMLHVGALLLDLLRESMDVIDTRLVRTSRNRSAHRLFMKPEAQEWFDKLNLLSGITFPVYFPCVEPPQPWTSPLGGAYGQEYLRPIHLVKTRSKAQREIIANAPDLSRIYSAVNAVQNTAWSVNRKVLDTLTRAWEAPAPYSILPQKEPSPLPDMPADILAVPAEHPDRLAFRRLRRSIHFGNNLGLSNRYRLHRLLSVVNEFTDQPNLYFAHVLDFRGRLYPLAVVLSPQGDDMTKSLLHFAEGKPLGARGLYWLGVHGANVFGNDKVSLDDRYKWSLSQMNAAMSVAYDPLTDTSWMDADKPWQYLAWCFEWAEVGLAQSAGHTGWDVVSSLPIALDGSCNGLQHFAAMLRDPVTGAAVNLVPSDKPKDIYQTVADAVINRLTNGDFDQEEQYLCRTWLDWGIDRKTTKRAVMVLPYGGTYSSCREYVTQAVNERGDLTSIFGEEQIGPATTFLASQVWQAMSETITSGRAVMTWIQGLARKAASENKTLRWTAPTGLPVVQHYPDTRDRRIRTHFHGQTTKFSDTSEVPDTISRSRLAAASSPNFIHSLDAAALTMTVNACHAKGIRSFAMIHDSYGTHASDTDLLNATLREQFVEMYEQHDPLEALHKETQMHLGSHVQLDPPPPLGSLDLKAVLDSKYFFA